MIYFDCLSSVTTQSLPFPQSSYFPLRSPLATEGEIFFCTSFFLSPLDVLSFDAATSFSNPTDRASSSSSSIQRMIFCKSFLRQSGMATKKSRGRAGEKNCFICPGNGRWILCTYMSSARKIGSVRRQASVNKRVVRINCLTPHSRLQLEKVENALYQQKKSLFE